MSNEIKYCIGLYKYKYVHYAIGTVFLLTGDINITVLAHYFYY